MKNDKSKTQPVVPPKRQPPVAEQPNECVLSPSDSQADESPFYISFEKMKDLVEVIGKLSIGFVALCYAAGLLVVNIHLNKYGAYSMSLFRLNYVAAGMWDLLPLEEVL